MCESYLITLARYPMLERRQSRGVQWDECCFQFQVIETLHFVLHKATLYTQRVAHCSGFWVAQQWSVHHHISVIQPRTQQLQPCNCAIKPRPDNSISQLIVNIGLLLIFLTRELMRSSDTAYSCVQSVFSTKIFLLVRISFRPKNSIIILYQLHNITIIKILL